MCVRFLLHLLLLFENKLNEFSFNSYGGTVITNVNEILQECKHCVVITTTVYEFFEGF